MEFSRQDSDFFRPLTSKNARFYYECAQKLIDRSKEMPVLYERDAREIIANHMKQIRYELEDEGTDGDLTHIEKGAIPAENAGAVIAKFRTCGWISKREIGRSSENLATVTARCRKIIETIRRVFDAGASGAITNHIFSIYEILYSSLEWNGGRQVRPYTNILEPLTDHEFDLKEELLILRDGIHGVMNGILRLDSANGLASYMVKDELLNRFFRDYFFMKKDGTIPGLIARINILLAQLTSSAIYGRIVSEYAMVKGVERYQAENAVEAQFEELEYFLNHGYDEQMAVIDEKIAAYYNLYAARISMIRNNSMNTQNYLNRVLTALKDMDTEKRQESLQALSASMRLLSFKMIGKKSFERRKQAVREHKDQGYLIDSYMDEEELYSLTESLYGVSSEKYGIDAAREHISKKLTGGRKEFSVKEEPIITKEEALMIASAVIYSSTDDFPYRTEFNDTVTDHGIAEISDFVIKEKEGNHKQ